MDGNPTLISYIISHLQFLFGCGINEGKCVDTHFVASTFEGVYILHQLLQKTSYQKEFERNLCYIYLIETKPLKCSNINHFLFISNH